MRPAMRTSTAAVIALFALAACHSRKGRYLAGAAAAATSETSPEARDGDALRMVTLPPVTVLAAPPAARTSVTPTTARRSGEAGTWRSPRE